jgi:vacuolar-type H+-ATPase subunit I/STV1
MKVIKKTYIYIMLSTLLLLNIFTFASTNDNIQSNSSESENATKVNITELYTNQTSTVLEEIVSNITMNNINKTEEKLKDNKEEIEVDTNQQKTKEEIEKKIEEKIKENINENKENLDIINKYKDFNLTEEIEKQYDDYQDDKDSDYFRNLDDLEEKKAKKKKSKKETEEEKYNQEWDEKVSKLHAHDLLTLNIKKKDYEVFYEQIDNVPVTITTAFYVHEEKNKIDFEINNPKKKNIYKLKLKNRGFYEFEIKEPGRYEFILSNERVFYIYLVII